MIRLPIATLSARRRILFWGATALLFFYAVLGECPLTAPRALVLTPLDSATPLLPWTFFVYLSYYFFILASVVRVQSEQEFNVLFYRLILSAAMSFAVFLFFPTVYPRSELTMEPFWNEAFAFMHLVDRPTNCFPSLHISLTLTCALSMSKLRFSLRWLSYAWAAAICLSTLTTKQHYAVDIIGGMVVTYISMKVVYRLEFEASAKRFS